MTWFLGLSPILQALIGTLFTWFMTTAGALPVLFTKSINQNLMDWMLGMASGVMIAASYWSLLAPAIAMAEAMGGVPAYVPAVVGFLGGGAFLFVLDKLLPHLHPGLGHSPEGIKTSWKRSTLLVTAITLHNIPEGLAVGVAFGAAAYGVDGASVPAAIVLALGIGIQNFPEGMAVAMPLRREGMSRRRAFMYGQMSGIVEPAAGVLGVTLVLFMQTLLPYALSFAAGTMIYVVAEELIPESKRDNNSDVPTIGVMVGFAIMMTLDVALG